MANDPNADAPSELRFGAHLFRWEPPDLAYVAYCGDLGGPTSAAMSQASRRFTLGKPRVLILIDMSRIGRIAKEVRRVSAEGSKDLAVRGTAIVGASPHQRVLANLVSRGVALLYGKSDNPTRFFTTEAEARAWIAERRRELDAR